MTKPSHATLLSFLALDPAFPTPLYRQLYQELRRGILEGRLAGGTRLPSTRELALELGISRRPAREAFQALLAEGLLVSRYGSGTFVREKVARLGNGSPQAPSHRSSAAIRPLSKRGRRLAETFNYETRAASAFAPTLPAADEFPRALWAKLTARRWRDAPAEDFRKADPAGYWPLRVVLAEYLRAARGLSCAPDQVIVTAGSTQAVGLLARLLLEPDDKAWVENPGWPTGRQTLLANGVHVVPVPVDGKGLIIEAGRAVAPGARLALVCPSRQYPLGMPMALERRLELVEWAFDNRSWIVEDDYDGEFQYSSRILPSLQSLDRDGAVIYMGSLSKVLTQALRIGYLVVPPALAEPLSRAMSHEKVVPTQAQGALHDFFAGGHFAAHTRRMRQLYRRRQEALVAALERELGGAVSLTVSDSGFHLLLHLPEHIEEARVQQEAEARGLYAPGLAGYFCGMAAGASTYPATQVLGFANTREEEMPEAVRRLGEAIRAASR